MHELNINKKARRVTHPTNMGEVLSYQKKTMGATFLPFEKNFAPKIHLILLHLPSGFFNSMVPLMNLDNKPNYP